MPNLQQEHLEKLLHDARQQRYISRAHVSGDFVTLHIGRVMYTLTHKRAAALLESALRYPQELKMNSGLPTSLPW